MRRPKDIYPIDLVGHALEDPVRTSVRAMEGLFNSPNVYEDVGTYVHTFEEKYTLFMFVLYRNRLYTPHVLMEFLEENLSIRCKIVSEDELARNA